MKCGKRCLLLILTVIVLIGVGVHVSTNYLLTPGMESFVVTTNKTSEAKELADRSPKLDLPGMVLEIRSSAESGCPAEVVLSHEQLLALPQQAFTTRHTWLKNPGGDSFSGPLLEDVLSLACPGKKPVKLHLRALDGYAVDANFQLARKYGPIIALSTNGGVMQVRDKGPLWIMAPLDKFKIPEGSLDELLIWQLYHISIITVE